MSRLRFENRHPDRPKSFFVREYHEGRDVPKQILALTQPNMIADPNSELSGSIPLAPHSTLIEADISTGSGGSAKSSGGNDNMKTMSDDYRQRLYATKAALKAALQHGDKDLSILEYIKAKKEKDKAKAREKATNGGDHDASHADHDEQTKEGQSRPREGGVEGDGEKDHLDAINKGVLFDEQLKEDLDKIIPYDPR